ncbi:hypothetical protein AA313_de0207643 [Arthrobotrys entomopaga]|nr:hypothetical protein AA313_de0207643 [Arthrobotrys entomopaga]
MAIENVVETAVGHLGGTAVGKAAETNKVVEGEVVITHNNGWDQGTDAGDDIFGKLNPEDANRAIDEAIYLDIVDDDDENDEMEDGGSSTLPLRRPGSRLFSQNTPLGESELPGMQIEEEVEEDKVRVDPAAGWSSEQADNSQQDDNDVLFFPESVESLTPEDYGGDGGFREWVGSAERSGVSRGHSAQDLRPGHELLGLWGTRGSRSEDVVMDNDNTN